MPHIHEKIDITATAYLVHNGKVLLRMHDKYKMWLGPGGHVELDEDINQAMIREIKEEVGLDVTFENNMPDFKPGLKNLVPPDFMNIHKVSSTMDHRHMDMVYLMRCDSDKVVPGYDGDRSDQWKWFTLQELEALTENIWPETIYYAKAALKKFGQL